MSNAEPLAYRLEIDGREILEQGVSLTITNSGHIGIGVYIHCRQGLGRGPSMIIAYLLKDRIYHQHIEIKNPL